MGRVDSRAKRINEHRRPPVHPLHVIAIAVSAARCTFRETIIPNCTVPRVLYSRLSAVVPKGNLHKPVAAAMARQTANTRRVSIPHTQLHRVPPRRDSSNTVANALQSHVPPLHTCPPISPRPCHTFPSQHQHGPPASSDPSDGKPRLARTSSLAKCYAI